MTIGRFPRSKLSSPKPNIAKFGQIAKVQNQVPQPGTDTNDIVLKMRYAIAKGGIVPEYLFFEEVELTIKRL